MTLLRHQPNCEDPNNSRWHDEEIHIVPKTYTITNIIQLHKIQLQ